LGPYWCAWKAWNESEGRKPVISRPKWWRSKGVRIYFVQKKVEIAKMFVQKYNRRKTLFKINCIKINFHNDKPKFYKIEKKVLIHYPKNLIGFVKVRIKSSCSFQTENRQNNTPYLTV
jgi:hypothetical protein